MTIRLVRVNPRVHRLMVFNAMKKLIEYYRRCPTVREISAYCSLNEPLCRKHMKALSGAAGLEYSTREVSAPVLAAREESISVARAPVQLAVDKVMRESIEGEEHLYIMDAWA